MTDLNSSTVCKYILDLNNHDCNIREKSILLLPQISQILGFERTIIDLIPFVFNSPVFTEKDFCSALQQFSNCDFSQCSEDHIDAILKSLDPLLKLGNTLIINENAEFIKNVYSSVNFSDTVKFEKLQNKICEYLNETLPGKQVMGIRLSAISFSLLSSEQQSTVLSNFLNLAQNAQSLYTQRYVIDACTTFIQFTDNQSILDLVLNYANSPSPTVSYSLPQFIISYLSKENNNFNDVWPIIQRSLKSPNKRVKYNMFNSLKEINNTKEIPNDTSLEIFNIAVEDTDEEVRIAAASQISILPINSEKSQEIINSFIHDEHSAHVRTSVITELSKLSEENPEFVKKTISSLLKDQVREVRLGVIDSLHNLKLSDENELLPSILIDFLNTSKEWREHYEVAQLFVDQKMHNIDILTKLLLNDSYKVRLLIVLNLPQLTCFGLDELMPIISGAAIDLDYQIRQTAALSIISMEVFDNNGVDILANLTKDPVSNVRLVVAKYTPRSLGLHENLKNDPDADVREFAILDDCFKIQI